MEQMNNNTNPGKGLGTGGFVIGLIALIIGIILYFVCATMALVGGGMGLAIGWAVIGVAGFAMSFMGMQKAKSAGQKPGLAVGGVVVGALAILLSISTIYTVHSVHAQVGDVVASSIQSLDSLTSSFKSATDSLSK
jgi:uncharacterized membrane-anchored protein